MTTLTDEMRADGWIEHDGGPCPIAARSLVQVLLKSVTHPEKTWDRGGPDTAIWFDSLGWWTGTQRWVIFAYKPYLHPYDLYVANGGEHGR